MLIDRKNSHAPRDKRRSGRHKAQSREQKKKKLCTYILLSSTVRLQMVLLNEFKHLYLYCSCPYA
jgi:hypothetical protein